MVTQFLFNLKHNHKINKGLIWIVFQKGIFRGRKYKKAKQANQPLGVDGVPHEHRYDLEIDNPAYREEANVNEQNFTDFSGSRERAIDVGPLSNDLTNSHVQQQASMPIKLSSENQNLKNVVKETMFKGHEIQIQETWNKDQGLRTIMKETIFRDREVELRNKANETGKPNENLKNIVKESMFKDSQMSHMMNQSLMDELKFELARGSNSASNKNLQRANKFENLSNEYPRNDPFIPELPNRTVNYQHSQETTDEDFDAYFKPMKNMDKFVESSREELDDILTKKISELSYNNREAARDVDNSLTQSQVESNEETENDLNDNEINLVFNKENIEENLPELFGAYTSNKKQMENSKMNFSFVEVDQMNRKNELRNSKTNGREVPRIKAPLGFSSADKLDHDTDSSITNDDEDTSNSKLRLNLNSIELDLNRSSNSRQHANKFNRKSLSSDDDRDEEDDDGETLSVDSNENDFKSIDSNAVKNMRIEVANNNFVIDSNKANTLRELKSNNEALNAANNNNNNNSSNPFGTDDFGMFNSKDEMPKPRNCFIKIDPNYNGLGMLLFDNKTSMIRQIEPNSPADKAGLKLGDKILAINNENVETASFAQVTSLLKQSLDNDQSQIKLTVMNAVEYNLFKGNLQNKANNSKPSEGFNLQNQSLMLNSKSESPSTARKQNKLLSQQSNSLNKRDYNPFDDVPNEMSTPFLHYTSIPPPENFKANNFFPDTPENFDQFQANELSAPFDLNDSNMSNRTNSDIMNASLEQHQYVSKNDELASFNRPSYTLELSSNPLYMSTTSNGPDADLTNSHFQPQQANLKTRQDENLKNILKETLYKDRKYDTSSNDDNIEGLRTIFKESLFTDREAEMNGVEHEFPNTKPNEGLKTIFKESIFKDKQVDKPNVPLSRPNENLKSILKETLFIENGKYNVSDINSYTNGFNFNQRSLDENSETFQDFLAYTWNLEKKKENKWTNQKKLLIGIYLLMKKKTNNYFIYWTYLLTDFIIYSLFTSAFDVWEKIKKKEKYFYIYIYCKSFFPKNIV